MYKKITHSWLKHWDFIFLDLFCMQSGFWLAYVGRHGIEGTFVTEIYQSEAFILFGGQLIVIFFGEMFKNVLHRGYYVEFVRTVTSGVWTMMLALAVMFVIKTTESYSRIVFVMTAIWYVVLSYLGRTLLKKFLENSKNKKKMHSMIVITISGMAMEVLDKLEKGNYQQYFIKAVGLLDNVNKKETVCGYPVLCEEKSITDFACREWVDEVLFVIPAEMELPKKLIDTLSVMGITTHISIMDNELIVGKQFVEKIGNYTVLTTSINIVSDVNIFWKRAMDIAGGLVGCVLTLILMAIFGPMIYRKSPGPIIFSQTRIGRNGKKFKIYKFRSMYLDAEERKKELMKHNKMDGLMFKMDYDPRIIGSEKIGKDGKPKGIGNFIRATSIDEFPQFWNVLKGDMSLVGTRPPTIDEWEKYDLHHRARMAIKPGITGMWQVSGRSDITDFEEVVRLDKEYIERWNLGLDIKILLMTILNVIKHDGAV